MRLLLRDGEIDLARREVRRGGEHERLTAIEASLLAYLHARPGGVATREELEEAVWEYRPGVVTRAVHHAVTRLRRKIEVNPEEPQHLLTVYGQGYRLELATPTEVDTSGLVGRHAERAAVNAAFARGARLVTLHGCGGIGKTRLARAIAPDATWCAVAGVEEPAQVAHALIAALGGAARGDPEAALAAALRAHGAALVVLDDLDAVADTLGPHLARWLAAAPEARILATSRVRLGVAAEVLVELGALSDAEGRALLAARAPAGLADEAGTTRLLGALGGIPLAILLAAPRLAILSPAALADRLAAPLDVLRGAAGGRQATMRAVLETSWRLLSPDEQRALACLGIFRGSTSIDAAEQVIGKEALAAIEGLAAASWLTPAPDDHLAMFEVQRAWARERLAELPDRAEVGRRHLAWCLATFREGARALEERWDAGIARRARHSVPEALAAFERERARDPVGAAAVLAACWPSCTGAFPVTTERLDAAVADLAASDAPEAPALRGELAWLRGLTLRLGGHLAEARTALEDARARAAALGDGRLAANVAGQLGNLAALEGRPDEAEAWFRTAIAATAAVGARAAVWTGNLGNAHLTRGEHAEAERQYLAALAQLGEEGNPGDRARLHANLGSLALRRGEHAAAADSYARAEALFREVDERVGLAQLLGNRAVVLLERGELDAAEALAREARALHRRLNNRRSAAIAALTLAEIAFERPDAAAALEHALVAREELRAQADRIFLSEAALLCGACHHLRGERDAAQSAYDEALAGAEARTDAAAVARAALWREALAREEGAPGPMPEARDEVGRALAALVEGWGTAAGAPARSRHAEARRMGIVARRRG